MKWLLAVPLLLVGCTNSLDDCDNNKERGSFRVSEMARQVVTHKESYQFNSCAEVSDYMMQRWRPSIYAQGLEANPTCSVPAMEMVDAVPTTGVQQPTNTQEEGIDEAGLVKISKKYIFYARKNSIEVLDRKTRDYVQSIPAKASVRPQIYVYGDTLVVLQQLYQDIYGIEPVAVAASSMAILPTDPGGQKITASIYDIRGPIRLQSKKTLVGRLVSSRLNSDGLLSLITTSGIYALANKEETTTRLNQLLSQVDCTKISRSMVDDGDFGLSSVYTLDLSTGGGLAETHITGRHDTVYMKESLYLIKSHVYIGENNPDDPVSILPVNPESSNTTSPITADPNDPVVSGHMYMSWVTRLQLHNNKWQEASQFGVGGIHLGMWSFHERDNYLLVGSSNRLQRNVELSIFEHAKDKTQMIAQVAGLAPDETLRSARFDGDYAYLVTFRDVDPLFVINIADPKKPKLLSELKIPGFSSYLHKTGDEKLIGVGYTADWNLQMSLFDVADKESPRTIEQIQVGDNGYSDAQRDHHAFFYDDKWKMVAVPYSGWSEDYKIHSGGAYLYHLSPTGFGHPSIISHGDWYEKACNSSNNSASWSRFNDIRRVLRIDDQLYSFSDFGVRIHSVDDPESKYYGTLFANPHLVCPYPVIDGTY